jgi:hypothetical protein
MKLFSNLGFMPNFSPNYILNLNQSFPHLVHRLWVKSFLGLFSLASAVVLVTHVSTSALSDRFDPGLILSDQDIYSLPLSYSSKERIQNYLQSQGSVLANYSVIVSLEPDDINLNPNSYPGVPDNLLPRKVLEPYLGKSVSVAELVWLLSQTNLGNSCSRTNTKICFENDKKPINPAFLLTMIQKESGLVYGRTARSLDINSQSGKFLLDRVLGYYCFENPDRSKSCYDENPNWKYFKGFFRQMYYATRLIRLQEEMCKIGGQFAFTNSAGRFQVGNTVIIDGTPVLLKNGITCALYVYTPHIYNSQYNVWRIMKELGADQYLINIDGIDPNYRPKFYFRR